MRKPRLPAIEWRRISCWPTGFDDGPAELSAEGAGVAVDPQRRFFPVCGWGDGVCGRKLSRCLQKSTIDLLERQKQQGFRAQQIA